MEKVNIKCYLCGGEAIKYLAPDRSRDEIVECKGECFNRYRVIERALQFYLDKKEGDEVLTKKDRFKVSEYVYKQLVVIDTNVIEKVTGKKSVGFK